MITRRFFLSRAAMAAVVLAALRPRLLLAEDEVAVPLDEDPHAVYAALLGRNFEEISNRGYARTRMKQGETIFPEAEEDWEEIHAIRITTGRVFRMDSTFDRPVTIEKGQILRVHVNYRETSEDVIEVSDFDSEESFREWMPHALAQIPIRLRLD